MRKIIAILVGLVMLFSIPALGEEVDFSKMSIDELSEMYLAFIKEFQSRTEEQYGGSLIFEGDYVAGKDIKPGRYQFICAGIYDKPLFGPKLYFEKPVGDIETEWEFSHQIDIDADSPLPQYFDIDEGMKIRVLRCNGVLIPMDLVEKPVWEP